VELRDRGDQEVSKRSGDQGDQEIKEIRRSRRSGGQEATPDLLVPLSNTDFTGGPPDEILKPFALSNSVVG
jgi:hypothetical protein